VQHANWGWVVNLEDDLAGQFACWNLHHNELNRL
jgi:hypothetical protein